MYRGNLATKDLAPKVKTCPRCRQSLPIGEFDPNRARRDGRQVHCRKCRKAQRDLFKANGAHRNGNGRGNGYAKDHDHDARDEEEEASGYVPIWRKSKVNRKDLLLQRERYMNIINAASLALERIEERLGITSSNETSEDLAESPPPEVAEDLSDEDLEDNLG